MLDAFCRNHQYVLNEKVFSYSGKLCSVFRDLGLSTSGECFTFTSSGPVVSIIQHACPNSRGPGYRPKLFILLFAW